jgi:type IV pilus assembly protein PilP
MIYRLKIIFLILVFGLCLMTVACEDKSQLQKKSKSNTVSGKISQPVIKTTLKKDVSKKNSNPQKESNAKTKISSPELKTEDKLVEQKESEHYDSKGKIDPFAPLIQEKSPQEDKPVVDNRPKRILTPLEKIDLSQIRLVAVIIMENRSIAMVEEASGKGYEVEIGTYIGRNQGKVFEIRKSSIVVKELVKDFKGRLKERVKEIKLHKLDGEG